MSMTRLDCASTEEGIDRCNCQTCRKDRSNQVYIRDMPVKRGANDVVDSGEKYDVELARKNRCIMPLIKIKCP